MPNTPHKPQPTQAMASLDQGGINACPMPVRRPRQASSIMESSSQAEGMMMKGVNATLVSTTAAPAAAGTLPTTTMTTTTTTSSPGAASVPAAQSNANMGQDSLIHALAGGLGSAIALALTYPLDQVRTFQQVNDNPEDDEYINHGGRSPLLTQETCPSTPWARLAPLLRPWRSATVLVQKHGLGALYRGIVPVLISMGLSNAVFFFVSNLLKAVLTRYRKKMGKNLGYFGHLATSTIAGVLNVLLTTPLWVASMRAKLSKDQGWDIVAIMMRIYREEGVMSLWNGTMPSLLLVCNPVLQHFVYDQLKRRTLTARRAKAAGTVAAAAVALTSIEAFYFGAVGKFVATIVSYPLQVAQSRLRQQSQKQEQEADASATTATAGAVAAEEEKQEEEGGDVLARSAGQYTGTVDCLMDLWGRKGLAGLFQGLESKLLQTVVTSAFMFLAYENIYKATKHLVEVGVRERRGRLA